MLWPGLSSCIIPIVATILPSVARDSILLPVGSREYSSKITYIHDIMINHLIKVKWVQRLKLSLYYDNHDDDDHGEDIYKYNEQYHSIEIVLI